MNDRLPGQPNALPERPWFSSGPCAKPPGWSLETLASAALGTSHRAAGSKAKLQALIDRSLALLDAPAGTRLAIVPASDTGAVEMALWSMLGARGVDVLAWESFGKTWADDLSKQLKLPDLRVLEADYGALPDLTQVDPARDLVFAWNGTTSGVCVPDGDWIEADREGLVFCDATSAVFALPLPLEKLDVVTWSWQKALGGEAAHGMLMLSPRAVARLESYSPPWPLPKIFRLTKNGKLTEGPFQGATINTPSMLCVEDALVGLQWAEDQGGLPALQARTRANLGAVESWVAARDWIDFLADDPATRSPTSICLKLVAPWFTTLGPDDQAATAKQIAKLVADAGAGFDLGAYRDAPPGLRIWGGPTVETRDIELLLPWLDWAYDRTKSQRAAA